MYDIKQLNEENEDGITILFYLQKIYPGMFFRDTFWWCFCYCPLYMGMSLNVY